MPRKLRTQGKQRVSILPSDGVWGTADGRLICVVVACNTYRGWTGLASSVSPGSLKLQLLGMWEKVNLSHPQEQHRGPAIRP